MQLLSLINAEDSSDDDRRYYVNKLARILWRIAPEERTPEPGAGELLAVTVWFTGVALFFQQHAIYSVLYDEKSDAVSKPSNYISLGVQEIIMELTAAGHSDARNMNLLDFFDAQIKLLKDRISEAKGSGTDTADLVKKTGLPLSTIVRLS